MTSDRRIGPVEQELMDRMRAAFERATGQPFTPDLDVTELPLEKQVAATTELQTGTAESVVILAQYVDQILDRLDALERQ